MNNKNWKYCSPDKDELYQASCIPAAPRAEEHPTPAPKWGLDEGFAAVSAASRKAKRLPQVNTIPTELWRAIQAANGGELSEEDISAWKNIIRGQDIGTIKQIVRGQPISPKELYRTKPSTLLQNEQKSINTEQFTTEGATRNTQQL